jgi:transcriptional regulator GlxA family with amidase domain
LREVNEQLHHANSYAAMIETANTFIRVLIRKQKKPRSRMDDTLSHFIKNNGKVSIEKLSGEACLSIKQLERKFKETTGVNPKLYARIIRFDKAFRLKNSRPELDWLRIAVECDYHDYQHLAKDYKDFTCLSPNAFHEIENNAPERSFGLSEGYYE